MSVRLKRKASIWINDLIYYAKQGWIYLFVSLLCAVLGITLAILEPKLGDVIFVKIYGNKIYLIFVQISTIGSIFAYEFFPALILAAITYASCIAKGINILSDLLFAFICYYKTLSIIYLIIYGGILGKMLGVFLVAPFFIVFILWYMVLKAFWIKNKANIGCKAGECMKTCLYELLFIYGLYLIFVIGEMLIFAIFLGF